MDPVQQWCSEVEKISGALARGEKVMWRCHENGDWHDMRDMPLSALVFSPELEYKVVSDD